MGVGGVCNRAGIEGICNTKLDSFIVAMAQNIDKEVGVKRNIEALAVIINRHVYFPFADIGICCLDFQLPLLGLLPSVIYSPLDIDLIHGSPEIRRRFMNVFLAQYKPSYATALFRYTHALRQRNALLKQHLKTTLSVWEETLRREATILQQERSLAIATLSERATQIYQSLTTTSEPFSILYKPSSLTFDANDLFLGYTTSGPHRDDLEFTLNTLSVKTYASEGQKRTCIAALRLAEAALLKPSLLLIDDFGIHLDHHRKQCLEEHLLSHPQLFISSPSFEKGHVIPL